MDTNKLLDVNIVTPAKTVFSGSAVSVSVPGSKGAFQVLFNHAPIVSSLDLGIIKIVDDKQKTILFATTQGFTEVHKNNVSILVDTADNVAEYNQQDAEKNLSVANEKLDKASSAEEKEMAQEEINEIKNLIKAIDLSK